jgi:hypothetical protein
MRIFMGTIGAHIEVDHSFVLPPQREHNIYLMDVILASGRFKSTDIAQINYCCLYLQAVTLSDLTLGDGRHLDPPMRIGRPSPT